MPDCVMTVGPASFSLRLERTRSPHSCAALEACLPLRAEIRQARWSGEAGWVPLGSGSWDVPLEHAMRYPAPGQLLLYPGGLSEPELLVPYGSTAFASRAGELAGNHVLTMLDGPDAFRTLEALLVGGGTQPFLLERLVP